MRLLDFCDEIMEFDVSPTSLIEEWAKKYEIKSDIEWNFFELVENIPDLHDLNGQNKNLMISFLKSKTNANYKYVCGRHSNVDCTYLLRSCIKLPKQWQEQKWI